MPQVPRSYLNSSENRIAIILISIIVLMIFIGLISPLFLGSLPSTLQPSPTPTLSDATPDSNTSPTQSPPPTSNSNQSSGFNTSTTQVPPDIRPTITNNTYTNSQNGYSFRVPANYQVYQLNPDFVMVSPQKTTAQERLFPDELGVKIIIQSGRPQIWRDYQPNRTEVKLLEASGNINTNDSFQLILIRLNESNEILDSSLFITQLYQPDTNQEKFVEISTGFSKKLDNMGITKINQSRQDLSSFISGQLPAYNQIINSFRFL